MSDRPIFWQRDAQARIKELEAERDRAWARAGDEAAARVRERAAADRLAEAVEFRADELTHGQTANVDLINDRLDAALAVYRSVGKDQDAA